MNALIVSRTSTPAQSHATQQIALRRYCNKMGLTIMGVMQIHYSAFKNGYAKKFMKDFEQSVADQMGASQMDAGQANADKKDFAHIVFWSGDRMCRNIDEFNILINSLHESGDRTIHFALTNHQIELSKLLDEPYSRISLQVVHEIIIAEKVSYVMSNKMKLSHEIRMKRYKRIHEYEKPYYGGKIEYGRCIKKIRRSGNDLMVSAMSAYHLQITDLINYMRTKKELDDQQIINLLNSNHIYSKECIDGKEANFYWEPRNICKIPIKRVIRPPIEFSHRMNHRNDLESKRAGKSMVIENRIINRAPYHMVRYRDGTECWIPGNDSQQNDYRVNNLCNSSN